VGVGVVAGVAGAQDTTAGQSPVVGGYAQLPPTVLGQVEAGTGPAAVPDATGVQGETKKKSAKPRAAIKVQKVERGTLPFTGLQIAFMLAGGLALLGLGVALRGAVRPEPA